MRHSALLSSLFVIATGAHAAEPSSDENPASWGGFAELGSVYTSGNSDTRTINGKLGLDHTGQHWESHFTLEALTTEEDGVTATEKYYAAIQFDRNFSETSYMAIRADQERDRDSGYLYQSNLSVGYGYRLLDSDSQQLDIEIGPGYQRSVELGSGDVAEGPMLRIASRYGYKISENSRFTQSISAEMGDVNSTYKSETGLKSQINGSLATKLTYKMKYVDTVPADTGHTDREFGVTLVYSF